MIITADLIRRFPFAVNPARMTEELEELIAEDMKQAARREGNFPAMPRIVNNEADVQLARAKLQAQIWTFLAHGPATKTDVRSGLGGTYQSGPVNRELETMAAEGRLLIGGRNRHTTYEINPRFNEVVIPHSPTSGDCVPALPGKPKAGPVPSIVTKPQGSDRPCGVEGAV